MQPLCVCCRQPSPEREYLGMGLYMDFMAPFTIGTGGHYITMLPADCSISTSPDHLPSSCHSEKRLWNPVGEVNTRYWYYCLVDQSGLITSCTDHCCVYWCVSDCYLSNRYRQKRFLLSGTFEMLSACSFSHSTPPLWVILLSVRTAVIPYWYCISTLSMCEW